MLDIGHVQHALPCSESYLKIRAHSVATTGVQESPQTRMPPAAAQSSEHSDLSIPYSVSQEAPAKHIPCPAPLKPTRNGRPPTCATAQGQPKAGQHFKTAAATLLNRL